MNKQYVAACQLRGWGRPERTPPPGEAVTGWGKVCRVIPEGPDHGAAPRLSDLSTVPTRSLAGRPGRRPIRGPAVHGTTSCVLSPSRLWTLPLAWTLTTMPGSVSRRLGRAAGGGALLGGWSSGRQTCGLPRGSAGRRGRCSRSPWQRPSQVPVSVLRPMVTPAPGGASRYVFSARPGELAGRPGAAVSPCHGWGSRTPRVSPIIAHQGRVRGVGAAPFPAGTEARGPLTLSRYLLGHSGGWAGTLPEPLRVHGCLHFSPADPALL